MKLKIKPYDFIYEKIKNDDKEKKVVEKCNIIEFNEAVILLKG